MSHLPVCSGSAAIRAFEKAGWLRDRQKGSHVTMIKPGSLFVLTIPLHGQLGPGLLRSLIRSSGLTVDEFKAFL
jgi:predicted RNA binding protein YcfA (HicA-like mRNA interferase family)